MEYPGEIQKFAQTFSDKSRKAKKVGCTVSIPHKVKPTGETLSQENIDIKTDISRLNLSQLRFLDAFRSSGWDFDKACHKVGVTIDEGIKTYKKCLWFKTEDEMVRAKAKVPTPEYILAKDLDNVEGTADLDDSQHKSLDRMAKITGSFKTTEVSVTQNVFNLPRYDAATEAKLKEIADREAMIIQEAQVVNG